jgi:hypothetical protein
MFLGATEDDDPGNLFAREPFVRREHDRSANLRRKSLASTGGISRGETDAACEYKLATRNNAQIGRAVNQIDEQPARISIFRVIEKERVDAAVEQVLRRDTGRFVRCFDRHEPVGRHRDRGYETLFIRRIGQQQKIEDDPVIAGDFASPG